MKNLFYRCNNNLFLKKQLGFKIKLNHLFLIGFIFIANEIKADILNGSFTNAGTSWITQSNFYCTNSVYKAYRTSPGYAWFASSDGQQANSNSIWGTLTQSFTMPSSYSSASVDFYSNITTDEITTTSPWDYMTCTVTDATTGSASQIKLSNLNASSGYVKRSISIPTSMAGHTLTLTFYAENDKAKGTVFRIDDVTLTIVAASSAYSLTLTVFNTNGTTVMSGSNVKLYDINYVDLNKSINTNSSGQAVFSSLSNGTYNYEVYFTPSIANLPIANNKEFWGSGTVTISGSSKSIKFTRSQPYISVGPTFTPVALNTGQQTSGTFTIKNALSYSSDTYVAVWVDRDKTSPWDYNSSATAKAIGTGSTSTFPFNVTPTNAGTYYCYAFVYNKVNGSYIITDQYNWVQAFTVTTPVTTGDLTMTVINADGTTKMGGANVKLYDINYVDLNKSINTNSSGQAVFSSLSNGTYNYEVYFTPSITNLPIANNKEFWGSGTVTISGSSKSITFTRSQPYISVGPTFTPAALNTGQQTSGTFSIKNALSYSSDTYVKVWVDRDKTSPWDYNSSVTAKVIGTGSTSTFTLNVTPTNTGTYSCYAFVYNKVNGSYIITDQYNWVQAYTANDPISTIQWSGYTWNVKNGDRMGPGPNNWLANTSNEWVDTNGNLHLKIVKIGVNCYCSEIYLQQSLGYGEYTFQVSTNVENLDKNIVLGFFTYETDSKEIDIEFSRWGNSAKVDGWYTVQPQPYNSDNQNSFALNLAGDYSTHKFNWNQTQISFQSYYGHYQDLPGIANLIKEWKYTGSNIPPVGNERVHLNLWLYGATLPSNEQEAEVIIKSFTFKKVEPTIIVTSPNGGENWQIGTTQNITWNSSNFTGNVNIQVNGNYPDGNWETLRENTANDGIESILITGQAGNAKRFRIISVDYPNISNISDGNFAYLSPLAIVAADGTALGSRKPLLLIHGVQLNGIPSEPDKTLWFNFYSYYYQDQSLKDKFKIYYVWYYSNLISVADLGIEFRLELDKNTEFEGKQISIIAHSMGGLVSRAFMNGTVNGIRGGDRVEKLITLGTPHHGSPMSNGPARYSALEPITATEIFTADQLYYSKNNPSSYQYNRSDLRWDNFDNLLDYNKYVEERNDWLSGSAMNDDRTYDNKIIAYAGSYDILDFNATYAVTDLLTANMFTWKFSKTELTDGIVPYCSASFQGHTLRKNIRFLKGYNHSRLPTGMTELDPVLFGALKVDLLDENTSLSELSILNNINVYPNPTTGKLEISGIEALGNKCKVEVFDYLGITNYVSEEVNFGNKISLDLSSYPVGLYLVKMSNNGVSYQKKVIKSNR